MKLLSYADQSVLVGDDAAEILIRFSAVLAEEGHADAISLNVLSGAGDEIEASFVIGSGTNLMAASTNSLIAEPDNEEGIAVMREKIERLTSPRTAHPSNDSRPVADDFDARLG